MKMSNRLWHVNGITESGDDWDLQFVGDEPSVPRINYVFAQEFPEEWDYMQELHIYGVNEVTVVDSYPSDGPELEDHKDRER